MKIIKNSKTITKSTTITTTNTTIFNHVERVHVTLDLHEMVHVLDIHPPWLLRVNGPALLHVVTGGTGCPSHHVVQPIIWKLVHCCVWNG